MAWDDPVSVPRRSRGRWRLSLGRAAVAVLSAWVALAPGEAGAADAPKVITVWTRARFNSLESASVMRAAETFNQSQGAYKVELFSANYRNYADWVQSIAGSGTLPCLLEIDGPYLAEFAWPGYLRPLDTYLPAELRRDLVPSLVAQGTYGKHLYSLGQYESGLGLWANRRYLRAAGLRIPTVARPWSLAEFEDAMEKLSHVPGVSYPLDLAAYTSASEFYAYAYLPLLAGFGGDLIDRATYRSARHVLDGPPSVAAMQRLQLWLARGWTRAVFDRNDDFEKGLSALLWTGHWRYSKLHEALQDDLVLLPLPDFGHGLKAPSGSWSWSITSTCAEPAGAWAFLAHLMSVDEILRVTQVNGAIPARRSALAKSKLYGPDGPLDVFAQQLFSGHSIARPVTPGYSVISKSFADAVASILRGGDVPKELGRAAAAIDADIAAHDGYRQ